MRVQLSISNNVLANTLVQALRCPKDNTVLGFQHPLSGMPTLCVHILPLGLHDYGIIYLKSGTRNRMNAWLQHM